MIVQIDANFPKLDVKWSGIIKADYMLNKRIIAITKVLNIWLDINTFAYNAGHHYHCMQRHNNGNHAWGQGDVSIECVETFLTIIFTWSLFICGIKNYKYSVK
mgnify:CR=1 FL=1